MLKMSLDFMPGFSYNERMEKREELERYYHDRDILEMDIDNCNEELKGLSEDDPDYDRLVDEINDAENEVACLSRWINDLEEELDVCAE